MVARRGALADYGFTDYFTDRLPSSGALHTLQLNRVSINLKSRRVKLATKTATAAKRIGTSKTAPAINQGDLTKGQLRKLNALRKSVGEEIAHKAFAEWLNSQTVAVEEVDKNAELIAELLVDQINQGKLRIPRGGYLVRRGRGRVVVEPAAN
jgi:hypothetical protein